MNQTERTHLFDSNTKPTRLCPRIYYKFQLTGKIGRRVDKIQILINYPYCCLVFTQTRLNFPFKNVFILLMVFRKETRLCLAFSIYITDTIFVHRT